ncbi:uncharacterized protein [Diadema antillarum]|uniref:uncharacterized protein n=1 Tax=Diadema antillarum TaxID=105358 RepID=UPI003A85BD88
MTDKRSEVAAALHQWASKEMHCLPQGKFVNVAMPTAGDLEDICRGNLLPIWQYVLEHVYSTQMVHKVKGNLAMKGHLAKSTSYKVKYQGDAKFSAEREDLIRKRRELKAKVAGVKSDVRQLDHFIEGLQRELLSAEKQCQTSQDQLSNIHQKRALLSQYSKNCKADAARYKEYQSRLEGKLQQLQSVGKESQSNTRYFSRQGARHGERTESPILETACTKTVRETCGEIQSFLTQLLQGDFSHDQQAIQRSKDKIWTQIEQVTGENSPQDVLQSLATITAETSRDLRQATSHIDIKKDAEDLRFKYEARLLSMEASPSSSPLRSVHQMIEEKQLAHIDTFKEGEKSRNRAWRLDKQLTKMAASVDAKLVTMFAGNPGALDLARKLFSTEMELTSSKAALQCLGSLKQDLSEVAASKGTAKEILYTKYKKIQDFKGLSDKKQNLIQVLVRQNMDASKKLEEKQKELGRYMESKLCSHKAGADAMTTKLHNSVSKEVEQFASLPLHLLQVTALSSEETVPVYQLSINRLADQSAAAGGGVLQEALTALGFPMYKAPECLLPYLTDLKTEMTDIQGIIDSQGVIGCYGDDQSGKDIIKHIQGLCQEVGTHDEEQLRRLHPVLQQRLVESSSAIRRCEQAREHVEAWWDQPSQHLTPWLKVEGHSMQQWLDKWTMAASQLRHLAK